MKQQENIKDPFDFAQGKQILMEVKLLCVALLFVFLFLNLLSSQFISHIYFRFINNDKKFTISFLQKIKSLSEYQKILEMNTNIYGLTIKQEILNQENKKNELINNLEQQLTINPKARDVLYGLYELYLAEGDKSKAGEYLRRAKEVDPGIK